MRISQLEGRRIAIWGYGREGRAALQALRQRLPKQSITVFCNEVEASALRGLNDQAITISDVVNLELLSDFDYIIKSPGISPYKSPAHEAAAAGVQFISGTSIWFSENPHAHTICVTGTKGKSTTTALIAHLLRKAGKTVALAGNIGLPLLELLELKSAPDFWVIELSSYQTQDARKPDVAVLLNLYPEHLDWHGSAEQYFSDKCALISKAQPKYIVLNALDTRLQAIKSKSPIINFNSANGWHVQDHWIMRGTQAAFDARQLPLPGQHNWQNLCAALTTIELLGLDALELVSSVRSFQALPHRLQVLGVRKGVEYVNDSISTTPYASLAALDCFASRAVAIIVGGYDRGLDWQVFADRMLQSAPIAVITTGQNGARINELLKPIAGAGKFVLEDAENMQQAVTKASAAVGDKGVVLLSPGAPSFPVYTDYAARGRHFAQVAGFDPELIGAIPGLGLA